MSELSQQLSQAADKNRELLYVLGQTDYAPPASKQNTAYISDLQAQIANTDKELQRLHASTEQERKDHVQYRDSVMRRYAHKLGGHKGQEKFASRQEKEEREFLEAWQREREAQQRREELARALEHGESDKRTLESDKTKHDQAQLELDQMYQSIFSGPTPEVPGEDQMEQAVSQTSSWFQQCQTQRGSDKQATEQLQRATASLSRALGDMNDALDNSNIDRFGGGALFDMMERDALSRGQTNLTQCLRTMDDARRAQSAIPYLHDVNIDQGHLVSDVLFDNIFTDMAQHDRIRDSTAQMQRAMSQLQSILAEQRQRLQSSQGQLSEASRQLEEARKELQRIRSEAFERLVGLGGGYHEENSGPPPAY